MYSAVLRRVSGAKSPLRTACNASPPNPQAEVDGLRGTMALLRSA